MRREGEKEVQHSCNFHIPNISTDHTQILNRLAIFGSRNSQGCYHGGTEFVVGSWLDPSTHPMIFAVPRKS